MPSREEIQHADQLEQLLRETERRVGRRMRFVTLSVTTEGTYRLAMAEVDAHEKLLVSGLWICDPADEAAMDAMRRRLS